MAEGRKKDAPYIADLFDPYIQKYNPHVNLVLFDGASNVQKAGDILAVRYPRITVGHGTEHVISLFFANFAKVPQVKKLIAVYKLVYRVFGIGAMHTPIAVFKEAALKLNNGMEIGLLRAADTRMAGYFYGLHCMLRLKDALQAAVHSPEFIEYARRNHKELLDNARW